MFNLFLIALTNNSGKMIGYIIIGILGVLSILSSIYKLGKRGIKKKYFTSSLTFLLLFCITYSIRFNSLLYMIFYLFFPLFSYLAGLFYCMANENKEYLDKIIHVSVIGFGVHVILNYIINTNNSRNELIDIYSGTLRSATLSGALNTLIFALLMYFIIMEKRKRNKMIGIFFGIISLIYSFKLGTRTQFIILFLNSILLSIFKRKKNKIVQIFKIILIGIFLSFLIYLLYKYDIFHIFTLIKKTNLGMRYTNKFGTHYSDETRWERFLEGMQNIILYPWGKPDQLYYHNMWLDVSRVAGIIPFIFITLYTIKIGIRVIKIYRRRNIEPKNKLIVLLIYIGFIINFSLEPAIEGMFDIVLWFFMFSSIIDYIFINHKKLRFSSLK